MAAPRAWVSQAKAAQAAALAWFNGVVPTALKETETALAMYGTALDTRQDPGTPRLGPGGLALTDL